MKKIILSAIVALATTTASFAQSTYSNRSYGSTFVRTGTTTVSGYTRSNGTYVQGHTRTKPNSTNWDNYSTRGNSNPYTGSTGTRARDYSVGASNYGSGHVIQTGPSWWPVLYQQQGKQDLCAQEIKRTNGELQHLAAILLGISRIKREE